jgi:hypothetical protein
MQRRDEALRILLRYGVDVNEFIGREAVGMLDDSITWHRELRADFGYGIIPLKLVANKMNDPVLTRLILDNGANPNYIFAADGKWP